MWTFWKWTERGGESLWSLVSHSCQNETCHQPNLTLLDYFVFSFDPGVGPDAVVKHKVP